MELAVLNVGDIVAFDLYRKEQKKKSLIATTKELYGENIPDDAVLKIERELQKVPGVMSENGSKVDLEEVQFLVWRSMLKDDPEITFEQAGEDLTSSNMQEYVSKILPEPEKLPAKKKKVKKKATNRR